MPVKRPPLTLLLLLLQLPLIFNPGYISHDELEWLARADVPWSSMPWVAWLDVSPLQFRPIAFNLWLVLAHAFGASPPLLHGVFVLIGTVNAWLLARVIEGMHVSDRVAYASGVVFALTPYTVYVHGWTGTLADLLTLLCGLVAVRCMQRAISATRPVAIALDAAAVLLAAIALFCKESAIMLPPLLALAAMRQPWRRSSVAVLSFSTAIVYGYLALRPVLAHGAEIDPAYAWSVANVPPRLLEYMLYPFVPPLFEIGPVLSKSALRLCGAGICVILLLGALAAAGKRWPLAWLMAVAVALGPVLLLPIAYNHYAYLAAAAAVAVCACAWDALPHRARRVILAVGAVVVVHGITVMPRLYTVGVVQRNLCEDLVAELRGSNVPLQITAADPRDAWLIDRLLRGVASYRGQSFAGRVLGETDPIASGGRRLQMNRDGHLRTDGPSLTPD